MATVTRENIGNLHDKLVVKITKEDYMPSFEKALKNYGKNANIPGFRKGNVPAGMIRKMYGQSVFADEVLKTADQELRNYLETEKPAIFAQPVAMTPDEKMQLDMSNPVDFEFPFEIGLKPNFEVTPLQTKKGALTRYKIQVSEEMLNEEVAHLQRRAGQLEPKESFEKDTDVLYADFLEFNEAGIPIGDPLSEVIEYGKLPAALKEQLKDKKALDAIQFKPYEVATEEELNTFMKDSLKKGVDDDAAKNASYKLVITQISSLTPRELSEAFYEELFPNQEVKTEEQFRNILKGEIEKQLERYATERLQNDIFETLVHETPLELPAGFLKTWLQKSGEKEKTNEEVEAEFSSFDHQLRWTLISDKLVQENNVEVTLDEVTNEMRGNIMRYFGVSNAEDAPWMDSYMQRMMKDEKNVEETYRRLLFDKLFVKLEEQLEVKQEEISNEDFAKLPSAHHHHHD